MALSTSPISRVCSSKGPCKKWREQEATELRCSPANSGKERGSAPLERRRERRKTARPAHPLPFSHPSLSPHSLPPSPSKVCRCTPQGVCCWTLLCCLLLFLLFSPSLSRLVHLVVASGGREHEREQAEPLRAKRHGCLDTSSSFLIRRGKVMEPVLRSNRQYSR